MAKQGKKSCCCSVTSHAASAQHTALVLGSAQKGMHKPIFLINDLQKPSIPNSNFIPKGIFPSLPSNQTKELSCS